jgi:hypothetical protein
MVPIYDSRRLFQKTIASPKKDEDLLFRKVLFLFLGWSVLRTGIQGERKRKKQGKLG